MMKMKMKVVNKYIIKIMKKLIFTLLFLIVANLSAAVVVPHVNPAIYTAAHRHSHSTEAAVDNSLQTSLTRKDYHFCCKKCNKDFVIHDMLYHENTDMYFYYKDTGYDLKVLQPFEGRENCDECESKQELTILGFILIIIFLGGSIMYYFNRG